MSTPWAMDPVVAAPGAMTVLDAPLARVADVACEGSCQPGLREHLLNRAVLSIGRG